MENTSAHYPPRSRRMPKTFNKARLIIARGDNHGRTIIIIMYAIYPNDFDRPQAKAVIRNDRELKCAGKEI